MFSSCNITFGACEPARHFLLQASMLLLAEFLLVLVAAVAAVAVRPLLERLREALSTTGTDPEVLKLIEELAPGDEPADEDCVICLGGTSGEAKWLQLKCGHRFHRDCLMSWLKKAFRCPVCRLDVNSAYQPGLITAIPSPSRPSPCRRFALNTQVPFQDGQELQKPHLAAPMLPEQDVPKMQYYSLGQAWVVIYTKDGRPYYHNHATGETTWAHPNTGVVTPPSKPPESMTGLSPLVRYSIRAVLGTAAALMAVLISGASPILGSLQQLKVRAPVGSMTEAENAADAPWDATYQQTRSSNIAENLDERILSWFKKRNGDTLKGALAFVPWVLQQAHGEGGLEKSQIVIHRGTGAVVFSDASGFTALTERLSKKSDGAELLSLCLTSFFTPLIDIINSYRGDVIKFSGDALTIYFQAVDDTKHEKYNHVVPPHGTWGLPDLGPEATSVLRASACCIEIHKRLHMFDTGVDNVRLCLHIGVGCGDVNILQVGGVVPPETHVPRCEYIIAGPPLEQISVAEPLAKNGETCLSPQAWAYVKDCVIEGLPLEAGEYLTDAGECLALVC
ncbi:Adenylate cyclase type 10 [Symbiodinium microadriaticum]|uniref:Adenylate cyclase type 10 n=1 Tax=Symbiodinium microadriaticum TaxID=2951 RepID=A0A1Q9F704_SYMMI|nr:Adenylate cyclase type 10 [Symbiodinium microadriaticum]